MRLFRYVFRRWIEAESDGDGEAADSGKTEGEKDK